MRAQGIDTSLVQGSPDWKAVKASGVSFAFVKLTEAEVGIDSAGRANVEAAHAAGLMVGAYHYAYVAGDPIQQANHFFQQSQGLPLDLPFMLDLESSSGKTPRDIILFAEAFIKQLQSRTSGAQAVFYSYPAYVKGLGQALLDSDILKSCLFFIADYSQGSDPPQDAFPVTSDPKSIWYLPGFPDWTFWQTSGNKGPMTPGIEVVTDRDVFHGTEGELRSLRARNLASISMGKAPNDLAKSTLGKLVLGVIGLGSAFYFWRQRRI
jgi:lysozyme